MNAKQPINPNVSGPLTVDEMVFVGDCAQEIAENYPYKHSPFNRDQIALDLQSALISRAETVRALESEYGITSGYNLAPHILFFARRIIAHKLPQELQLEA